MYFGSYIVILCVNKYFFYCFYDEFELLFLNYFQINFNRHYRQPTLQIPEKQRIEH